MRTVLGIDPGAQTGLAVFRDGALAWLGTTTPDRLGDWLLRTVDVGARAGALVVFEDSRKQRHVWNAAGLSRAAAIKVGRNVGQVDALCAEVERECQRLGLEYVAVSPLRKGAKYDGARFAQITGWAGRTSQHARDAALVAWPYRTARL